MACRDEGRKYWEFSNWIFSEISNGSTHKRGARRTVESSETKSFNSVFILLSFLEYNAIRCHVMWQIHTMRTRRKTSWIFSTQNSAHSYFLFTEKRRRWHFNDSQCSRAMHEKCDKPARQNKSEKKNQLEYARDFLKIHNSMIFAIINFAFPILAFLTSFDSQATSTMSWEGSHKKRACSSTCVSECKKSEAKTCPRLFIAIELN